MNAMNDDQKLAAPAHPGLTARQSREVDRRAVEEYGLNSLVLMENAGRGCVDVLERLGVRGPVVVLCGKGNNGGDGFVIARHLELRGYPVRVLLFADPAELRGDAAANWCILERGGTPLETHGKSCDAVRIEAVLAGADWIVDALLGTGATGEPRPPLDLVIRLANQAAARRLAVDLPSGLDADTGVAAANTLRATHTCTFVARKRGFDRPQAAEWLGAVQVCDIGAPAKLVRETLAAAAAST